MLLARWIATINLMAAGLQSTGWCAQPVRDPSPDLFISVQGDRVTARIERASLRQVLADLHRLTGLRAQFIDPADDGTVWKIFADVPLIDALYRLLEGRSFALYYDAAPASAAKPGPPALVVRILPLQGVSVADSRLVPGQPVPIMQPLPAPDEGADSRVPLPAAGGEKGSQVGATLDEIGRAMVDPDERVRARAQQMFDQALTNQAAVPSAPIPRGAVVK